MNHREVEVVVRVLPEQPVDAIANPWNRNLIPSWLLLPRGIPGPSSGEQEPAPFRELTR